MCPQWTRPAARPPASAPTCAVRSRRDATFVKYLLRRREQRNARCRHSRNSHVSVTCSLLIVRARTRSSGGAMPTRRRV
ncbi:hypothetical protein EVAR_81431_1 [Eumeta japonica]|uniref:Uncharacterized protein n=1 Tax=Eumeta variegata TaxID=151549 RepID=A0A4C1VZT1_EUMVA|nr:hypothetical protein EVAR_81431_1 [Eumeta japonica]